MMTEIEPQTVPAGRYNSKRASELLGIHRNTLRNKTNSGEIKCEFRKDGRRFYLGREIVRFWREKI